ncbi:MAG TPA: CGNR zinc finger domain-containing protein [Micromonosporaceae bacterium]
MLYVDYIGNVCRLVVELVNDPGELTTSGVQMFAEHHVDAPNRDRLAPLLPMLDAVLAGVADYPPGSRPLGPIDALLHAYPPVMTVSDHDGVAHLHFAPDHEPAVAWTARSAGAALAYVMTGDVAVTVGRCRAERCERYFVDDSRNRSRRFCSSTCASRTTVADYRRRRKESESAVHDV